MQNLEIICQGEKLCVKLRNNHVYPSKPLKSMTPGKNGKFNIFFQI